MEGRTNEVTSGQSKTMMTDYCKTCFFPFHTLKYHRSVFDVADKTSQSTFRTASRMFLHKYLFSKVHAAELVTPAVVALPANNVMMPRELLENIAQKYIEKETGTERIYMMFKKNHKNERSFELQMVKYTLPQILFVTFFIKYIPEYKIARKEFIKQHRATVFRTYIQALRQLQDEVSLRACKAGAIFSTKATGFSALFLLVSQILDTYRNKTSILDYTLAASLTGGLARLSIGPKAFVSGAIVGGFLGSIVGVFVWAALHATNMKQDQRHLEDIITKLEVERYILGEDQFKAQIEEIKKNAVTPILPHA